MVKGVLKEKLLKKEDLREGSKELILLIKYK